MTFQQLYYLLEVEKSASFSKAAQKLFVTQSTISNAIASIEKEVGGPIFIRGKKSLVLTPIGEDILAHAKRICESHKYITTGERSHSTMVRIGAVSFSPVFGAFEQLALECRDRRDVQLYLYDARNRNFPEDLLAYRLDLAVAKFLSPTREKHVAEMKKKGITYENLITLPAAVCIGPGHRLYDVPEFSMEELRGDPVIELGGKPLSRSDVMKAYLPVDMERSIVVNQSDARKRLLLSGVGYTVTHMPSAEKRGESPLRYIPVPGLSYSIFAFYDSLHPLNAEVSRFLELLRSETEKYVI